MLISVLHLHSFLKKNNSYLGNFINLEKQHTPYQLIKEKLARAGLKTTQQRIVIYHALIEEYNHPSAENIFEKVQSDNPSISLGTVYKTLDTFVLAGLVTKVLTDEGNMRYDANLDYHNHIYCTNTKEIIDYYNEELNQLLENFFREKQVKNIQIKDIRLQINAEKIDPDQDVEII